MARSRIEAHLVDFSLSSRERVGLERRRTNLPQGTFPLGSRSLHQPSIPRFADEARLTLRITNSGTRRGGSFEADVGSPGRHVEPQAILADCMVEGAKQPHTSVGKPYTSWSGVIQQLWPKEQRRM